MKKIKVEDKLEVRDFTPTGVVVMKEKESGKILFKKENMILRAGRNAIMRNLLSADLLKFTKMVFGTGSSASTTDMSKLIEETHEVDLLELDSIPPGQMHILIKSDELTTSGLNNVLIRELGLKAQIGSDTESEFLFSRLVIDPTPLKSGVTYSVEYYIYF